MTKKSPSIDLVKALVKYLHMSLFRSPESKVLSILMIISLVLSAFNNANLAVVPLPINGSYIISFLFDQVLMCLSTNSSGKIAGWLNAILSLVDLYIPFLIFQILFSIPY